MFANRYFIAILLLYHRYAHWYHWNVQQQKNLINYMNQYDDWKFDTKLCAPVCDGEVKKLMLKNLLYKKDRSLKDVWIT